MRNIPLDYVKSHLEKNAGTIRSTIKLMAKYPKATLVGVGGLGLLSAGTYVAKQIYEPVQLLNARTQRDIMREQAYTLQRISSQLEQNQSQPVEPYRPVLITPPLR